MAEQKYLWYQGIDIEQDAVIQAAIVHWKEITGANVNQNVMLKIIIMQYGEELGMIDKGLRIERNRKRGEFLGRY